MGEEGGFIFWGAFSGKEERSLYLITKARDRSLKRCQSDIVDAKELFLLFPQVGHIFQSFAFSFGYKFPHEDSGYDTDDSVEGISKHVAKFLTHITQLHIVHR